MLGHAANTDVSVFSSRSEDIKLMHLNVYGGLENKLELKDFTDLLSKYEIICLSECWISANCNVCLDGYECLKKVRSMKKTARRPSGGMVIFIKSSLVGGVENVSFDFEDGLCLKLKKEFFGWESDLFIVHVYFKGDNSPRNDLNDGLSPFDRLFDF